MIFWPSVTIVWEIRSEACAKKFDEYYKLRLVDMKKMFKDEKIQAQIDDEYRQRMNDLHEKIGIK